MSFTQAQPPAVEEDPSTASASEDVSGLVRLLEEDQKESDISDAASVLLNMRETSTL